jgi:hypothetical protein
MTDVTVPYAKRSVGVGVFDDITPAPVTLVTAVGQALTIRFDDSQLLLTANQIAAIQNRAMTANTNEETLRTQALTALGQNRTYYNAPSHTNLEVAAQVVALSRQMNGVIRTLLDQLDGID